MEDFEKYELDEFEEDNNCTNTIAWPSELINKIGELNYRFQAEWEESHYKRQESARNQEVSTKQQSRKQGEAISNNKEKDYVSVHVCGYYNNQMRRADFYVQLTGEQFSAYRYNGRAIANIVRQHYPDCNDVELPNFGFYVE